MGHEAKERAKMLLEFPNLGNWVAVILLIRIGRRGGEGRRSRFGCEEVMSSFLGQFAFEVPKGNGGAASQQAVRW